MALSIPLVWADAHRLHEPSAEIWVGVRTPAAELPARAERSAPRCSRPGADEVAATPHDDAALEAVHDAGLLAFLASAWADWEAAGLPDDPGQDQVVPYIFPHPGLMAGLEPLRAGRHLGAAGRLLLRHDDADRPGHVGGRAGRSGCGADGGRPRLGRSADRVRLLPAARPSRHAQRLRRLVLPQQRRDRGPAPPRSAARRGSRSSTSTRITGTAPSRSSGSGTTSSRPRCTSIPATGWFPHFLGGASERGGGAGLGSNLNVPLPPGARDDEWLRAVAELVQAARSSGAEALVLALGVDAAGGDPESPLDVTVRGFREAGRLIGQQGLPVVVVQEGGYDLASIGGLVLATLEGLQEGHGNA